MGMILGHTSPTNGAIIAHFRDEQSGTAILFRVARPSNKAMSPIVPALFCEERRALGVVVNVQLISFAHEWLANQGECPWLNRKAGSRLSIRTPGPAIRVPWYRSRRKPGPAIAAVASCTTRLR
jgi:hypothetical protein